MTCALVSLTPSAHSSAANAVPAAMYEQVSQFEKAFEQKDRVLFKSLLHPALQRSADQKNEAFDGTVQDFGLDKAKLTRNAVYKLQFTAGAEPEVLCNLGKVRGVVGPSEQYAVVHTFSGGTEQVRLFTLFAPILKGQAELAKSKNTIGLVMLHGQIWTHEKKAPDAMLEDARKWANLDEPVSAWLLAEGGRRILAANPYVVPTSLKLAEDLSTQLRAKITNLDTLRGKFSQSGIDWDFLDFTVVYQASGLEAGFKFRTRTEEGVEIQMEKCKRATAVLAKELPGLRHRFRGAECLAYGPTEKLQNPPTNGSQFFKWSELKL